MSKESIYTSGTTGEPKGVMLTHGNVAQASRLRQAVFHRALQVGLRRSAVVRSGRHVGMFLSAQHRVADRLVFRKVHQATGGRIRVLVSGSAPLARKIAEFFDAIGLTITEGYGLTEASRVLTVNPLGRPKFGTVGRALPGVELRIGEDGEILARGPNIIRGYYHNPEATRAVLEPDGWLHTGDIGTLDAEGYLTITDRKEDIMIEVTVRAYGPLNDFLPAHRRHVPWRHGLDDHPAVKDLIERLGIPHPEIDLILVNGVSVSFDYLVQSNDRIAVFPRFMSVDIDTLTRVRPSPLETSRFVADVHLGKLARHLRLAGLDTAYRHDADDAALVDLACREERILLTRDQGLLKRRSLTHGYFVRETQAYRQFVEVLRRFGPLDLKPFSRCLRCNDLLQEVPKSAVDAALLPRTRQHYDQFVRCKGCGRVYWKGSHWKRLQHAVGAAREEAARDGPRSWDESTAGNSSPHGTSRA